MTVEQLTIRIPNRPGELAAVSSQLGQAGVNILAFFVSTADRDGDGLMRFVPNNPKKARNVLGTHGVEVTTDRVLAAETPHHARRLQAILNPLQRAGINVDYVYPCIHTSPTILILGPAGDPEAAIAALRAEWIRLFDEELYAL